MDLKIPGRPEISFNILVTNDDGIAAPGLRILAESLTGVGDVVVVAPDREQSGVGASLSLHRPVRVAPSPPVMNGIEAYAVEGTPGDSVILATSTLVKKPVDLLVSGINPGANLGNDVLFRVRWERPSTATLEVFHPSPCRLPH